MSDSTLGPGKAGSPAAPGPDFRLAATIDHAPIGIAHFDLDGRFALVNDRLCEILGYTREHLLRHTFQEITLPEDLPECLRQTGRLAAGEIPRYQLEKRFVRPDGSPVWARVTVSVERAADGRPAFFIGVAEDVSERVELDEARRIAEQRLAQALDAARVGAFEFDVRTQSVGWARGLARLFGDVERTTLDGFLELIHPDDRERVLEAYVQSVQQGIDFEMSFRVVWPDGSIHWLHDRGCLVRGADGQPQSIVGALADVTNHRRLEEVIRQGEARFRALANAIPQMAWIADTDARRTWFNQRWYEYTGATPGEMEGHGWLAVHDPDSAAEILLDQQRAFREGHSWEATVRLRGRDGGYRWFLSRALPLRDEGGSVVQWFGTNTDVTEQKRAEREREEFLVSERAARAGAEDAVRRREQTLAFVAHDLRNPVQTVVMAAGALTDLPLSPEKRAQQLAVIKRSAWRMNRLIGDLLDASMIEAGTFAVESERLQLRPLIEDAVETLAPQASERALELAAEIDGELPELHGDRDRLMQVLVNLIGNAIKFTPQGGRVCVVARPARRDVTLEVRDTGVGIAAEHIDKVFGRFWQARRDSRGAGLGLMITRGIVAAHGGEIDVESELGRGTTFRVRLPLRPQAPTAHEPLYEAAPTQLGGTATSRS